jgi:hypothetical protein
VGDRCDDDAFDFDIEPGISGNWYDPDHNGEGWFIEVLNEKQALIYWFTYTPPGVGGDQAQTWIGGVGEIVGSSIVVPAAESHITTGPPFGPEFDPTRVQVRPWGKMVFSFSNCNSGLMYYRSDDLDYGNGSLDLVRLTQIGSPACGAVSSGAEQSQPQDEFELTAAMSGAWYDPSHNGEGWLLEILNDGQALLAWFTYDSEGRQAWFYNNGTVDGNTVTFDLLVPSGTDFGPTFDPNELNLPAWGRASFTFENCNSGSMTYDSPIPGYGSGSIGLTRLTGISGLPCN